MSNDSDISEAFKDLRKAAQQKREHNRRYSTKLLSAKRIKFRSANNGYHLIIAVHEDTIDFWPTTGLWKIRSTNTSRRGVRQLLEYIQNNEPRSTD